MNLGKFPPAVVMNMFYTGLGIARSLGERGVPVIGLSTKRGHYGNFTRYADVRISPDSRDQPELLLKWLIALGGHLPAKAVLFPTRDDDVVFLDRFRVDLDRYYLIAVAPPQALRACLDKWETYRSARQAGVAVPKCWVITNPEELTHALGEFIYPCVLKPVAAHHWRRGDNWMIVGGRKAFAVSSESDLLSEYEALARADRRVLVQEMVPGPDSQLFVTAFYLDRSSRCVSKFSAQKLVQSPEAFGTGCVVQSIPPQELEATTLRLLQHLGFTGIAEVEYKWDATRQDFFLIEINPRAWDQHRLGKTCGSDLVLAAYSDLASISLSTPPARGARLSGFRKIGFSPRLRNFSSPGPPNFEASCGPFEGRKSTQFSL